jgi:hypothetical protein
VIIVDVRGVGIFFPSRNTTMSIRKLGLSIIAAAALQPAICTASSEKTAFDSCVTAFEASIAAGGAGAPAYKILYRGNRFDSAIEQYFATEYTYDLAARNAKTGATRARARCTADSRGAVFSLEPLPLEEKAPALAAQY